MTSGSLQNNPPPQRRKAIFLRGFQLRFVCLVAGSLFVLLLFTGLHGLFVTQLSLPPEVSLQVRPIFEASTWRIFLIGVMYIAVVAMGAVFLSHRAVGPIGRLEEEIRHLTETPSDTGFLKIRESDELAGVTQAINKLIEMKHKQKGPL